MTEAEWRESTDPEAMLEWPGNRLSVRKKRLFAVACCRRIWPRLTDLRSRGAVDVAERYADGSADDAALHAAHEAAFHAYLNALTANDAASMAAVYSADSSPTDAARTSSNCVRLAVSRDRNERMLPERENAERKEQAELLRHIAGNPFRPIAVDPDWLRWNGGVVVQLASTIYEARLAQEMLLLGDALEDAGCTELALMDHCRAGGRHPRGCWVLDLLLGKG